MEPHWDVRTSAARQAAAADLWMELTGRKQAAAFEIAKEAMEKRASVVGGLVGAGVGAGVGALTAGKGNRLKGAAIGAGVGGLGGAAVGHLAAPSIARRTRSVVGDAAEAFAKQHGRVAHPQELRDAGTLVSGLQHGAVGAGVGTVGGAAGLAVRGSGQNKAASAAGAAIREYVRAHPAAAPAIGAVLLGVPAAAGGYLYEKSKLTRGESGKSSREIKEEAARAAHQVHAAHSKDTAIQRLKTKYHDMRAELAAEGSENPRRSAAVAALPYGILAGLAAAGVVPRVLR